MQPVVEAAWIAAGAGVLGVIGTVVVAVSGFRNTHKVTDQTIQAAVQASADAREAAIADRLWERKAEAYAAFITESRSYRMALRHLRRRTGSESYKASDLDPIAAKADSAASLVFIVLESSATYDACRAIVSTISATQRTLHDLGAKLSGKMADDLNQSMGKLLREFQVAAREELGVRGIDQSTILTRHS